MSASDFNQISSAAYSQQVLDFVNSELNSYTNSARGRENIYNQQSAGYQAQEIDVDHIEASTNIPQSQYDDGPIDETQNSFPDDSDQTNDGLSFGYDIEKHQSNAFDTIHETNGDIYDSTQQAIHTQAETFPISKHVEITKNVPYPVFKQLHVPGTSNFVHQYFLHVDKFAHSFPLNMKSLVGMQSSLFNLNWIWNFALSRVDTTEKSIIRNQSFWMNKFEIIFFFLHFFPTQLNVRWMYKFHIQC